MGLDNPFTLSSTGVTATAYGSGGNSPVTFTPDINGRLTAASTVSQSIAFLGRAQIFTRGQAGAVTAFSGSIPSPWFPDLAISNNWAATLSSGITIGFPTNIGTGGASGIIALTQSSSGACAVVLQSGLLSVGSAALSVGVNANQRTLLSYYTISANLVALNAMALAS